MRLFGLLLAAALVLTTTGEASASIIDFRTVAFTVGGANPDGEALAEAVVDGITVRVLPRPTPDAKLYWDSTDGFGVRYAYEKDEIEEEESLLITFWDALGDPVLVTLEKVFLTDLFNEDGYLEQGWYDIDDDGTRTNFVADPAMIPGSTNGERTLQPNQLVQAISFGAPGLINGQDHEFSVAGLEFSVPLAPIGPTPIPEPASVALFALGAAIVGRQVRRSRSN